MKSSKCAADCCDPATHSDYLVWILLPERAPSEWSCNTQVRADSQLSSSQLPHWRNCHSLSRWTSPERPPMSSAFWDDGAAITTYSPQLTPSVLADVNKRIGSITAMMLRRAERTDGGDTITAGLLCGHGSMQPWIHAAVQQGSHMAGYPSRSQVTCFRNHIRVKWRTIPHSWKRQK